MTELIEEEVHDHSHPEVDQVVDAAFAQELSSTEEEGEALDRSVDELLEESIAGKIRLVFSEVDQNIITRLEVAAEAEFNELFSGAIAQFNAFYRSLWVPVINPETGVWTGEYVKDEHGRYVESWDQLDGQTIEQCIMNLMRIKAVTSRAVNKLRARAVYAKMTADDVKDETWPTVKGGTVGDKTAKANRRSRQDRYHAFFTYMLWSQADSFQREIVDFMFRLKDVRMWRIQAQPR